MNNITIVDDPYILYKYDYSVQTRKLEYVYDPHPVYSC